MKKQRILALTLAAATATSMFGGFSASAADPFYDEAFGGAKGTDIYDAPSHVLTNVVQNINQNGYDWSFAEASTEMTFDAKTYYDFDFMLDKDNSDAAEDLAELTGKIEDKTVTADDFKNYYHDNETQLGVDWNNDHTTMSETREMALDAFEKALADSKKFALAAKTYEVTDETFYSEDDLKNLNISGANGLIAKMNAVKVANANNSELLYFASEYNRLDAMLSPISSWEEKYEEQLEKADSLVESDFTSTNWKSVQDYIDEAEYWAGRENWKKACELLNKALAVTTKAVDCKALNTAVEALFDKDHQTELTDAVAAFNKRKEIKDIPVYSGDENCTYKKSIYGDEKYTWIDFAGDSDTNGAYREAVAIYALCAKYDTRKSVAQSTVNTALENLQDAIRALNPDATTENWLIVKMEALLDKARAVNPDDYRTTALTWGKFEKAIEAAEKLLEKEYFTEDDMKPVYNELSEQLEAIKGIIKSVPTATKNELKALMKEAQIALDNKTGKTADQIIALEDALEAAGKVYGKSGKLISEYEKAIADLETAIAGYKQIQGWYQENGKWYYGVGAKKATGWIVDNGKDYYLNADGSMATGWVKSERGYWYWMDATKGGAMTKNAWVKVNNGYYFLQANGIMKTGWINDNGTWYYANPSSGAIVYNGWYQINGKHYYFYANGAMAANTTINGYKVDASGAWVK